VDAGAAGAAAAEEDGALVAELGDDERGAVRCTRR